MFRDEEGGGGDKKWENCGSETLSHQPSRQGKTFHAPPPLKSENFLCPPFNTAKTSSYCMKTIHKLFLPPPPFSMAKTAQPPFRKT